MKRIVWISLALLLLAVTQIRAREAQQVAVSATPASIVLPSPLPLSTQESVNATPTLTRTPTVQGPAMLEPLTEANVRGQPDPESELLGTIRVGDLYPIIGRYFRWYQFQYPQSPSGTGWVFDELVQIIGDEASITDLSVEELPTVDVVAQAGTETQAAVTQTPGGVLTQTAQVIQLPVQGATVPGVEVTPGAVGESAINVLPTFTFPPEVALVPPDTAYSVATGIELTPTPAPANTLLISISDGLPPITPVLLLGGFGLLGLFITSRRK